MSTRDDPTVDDSLDSPVSGADATPVPSDATVPVSEPTSPFEIGATLGRYHLRERLGEGGMGVVFAAYDPGLDRTVAVKVLRPGVGADRDEPHLRLQREGRVMARLSHPNVIQVYDVGYAHGSVFVAMEFIKGRTLKDWLDEQRAPEEIVRVFREAARGLAAAHDAGFVHRDFKPSNVLVSDDGRVLVTDFGLARALDATEPVAAAPKVGGEALYVTLTQENAIVGTPAYMAPEQYTGANVDARADQFSFCVALWHALHGTPPFAGSTWRELAEAVTQGRRVEPTASSNVPPRLRGAIDRGLSPDPARRWPSMHALLEAFAPRRRRGGALLAAGGAVVIAALAFALLRGGEAGDPCATPNDRFAGVWDPAARAEVERAFAATKIPYATLAFAEVARQLDRHRVAWEAMRRDSCEATRVRKEQSDAAMDLRAACLDGRFDAIAAFVGVLRRADAETIKGSVQRAASVGDVTDCADVAALQRRAPVPPDKREAALGLTPELAAARAEAEAGRGDRARAEALLARAKTLDYAPLLAEAYQIAALADEDANQPEDAERRLGEAVKAADAGGDDTRRYEIEIELTRLVGYVLERDADGLEHVARARALARRLGANPRREAQLARLVGIHHWTFGRYPDAIRETQRAIELYEQIDPEGGDHARALHNMAIIHDDMNDAVHGLPYEERAIAIASRTYGADHPSYQNMLSTKANLLRRLDRLDEAEALYRGHLAHVLRVHGPDSSQLGGAYMNLGGCLRDQGKLDEAIAQFRAAVAQYDRTAGPDHSWTANGLDNLGSSLSKTSDPALHEEAEQVLRRAVDIYTKRLGPAAPPTATATRHLAEHLARRGRHADTIPLYEGAIRAVESSQGKDSALLARPLLGLGEAHLALKHHAAARAALDRALEVVDDDPDDLQIRERIVAAQAKLPRR